MKKRPIFAIWLPLTALIIDLALMVLPQHVRNVAEIVWRNANWPVAFVVQFAQPIEEAIGGYWGIYIGDKIELIAVVMLWLSIGVLADLRRAWEPTSKADSPKLRDAWAITTCLLICALGVFLGCFWYAGLRYLHEQRYFDTKYAAGGLIGISLVAVWSILIVSFCIRNFSFVVSTVRSLLGARPDSSWKPYLPTILIPTLFVSDTFELIVLIAVGLLQLRYRTLAGWLFLTGWALRYSAMATINAAASSWEVHQLLFVCFGLALATSLICWHPHLRDA